MKKQKILERKPSVAKGELGITKEVVESVLSLDDFYRKEKRWPLVSAEELSNSIQFHNSELKQ
jgi:hypothetical protein